MIPQSPKISIVIPVYNAADTLQRCVASLVGQTESAIEIIAVDDCSTDGSLLLLNELSKSDERIRIIRTSENKGPGLARELGISHAQGEYIALVDSDDWCEAGMYKKLLHLGQSAAADIVMCDAIKHNHHDNSVIGCGLKDGIYTFEQVKDKLYLPLYGKDSRTECAYGYLWRFMEIYLSP